MAQEYTSTRPDLIGWGKEAARADYQYAVFVWYLTAHGVPPQMFVHLGDGTVKVQVDPALTEPDITAFQTEMDTLTAATGGPGGWVFTHL
jgi:hypothetical protein